MRLHRLAGVSPTLCHSPGLTFLAPHGAPILAGLMGEEGRWICLDQCCFCPSHVLQHIAAAAAAVAAQPQSVKAAVPVAIVTRVKRISITCGTGQDWVAVAGQVMVTAMIVGGHGDSCWCRLVAFELWIAVDVLFGFAET